MTRLDLNMLTSLHALLEERSVTRAALRLRLSQPSLSIALGRLRQHFGDELLVRQGGVLVLTPLAEELQDGVRQAVAAADRVFDARAGFVPEDATREFTLVMSDAQLPVFGRALAELVRHEAPQVRLRFEHSTSRVLATGWDWLRNVDALVLPHGILSGARSLDLYQDRYVCIVAAGEESTPLGLDDLMTRPWVVPYHPPAPLQSALHRLRQSGIEPNEAISTEDFMSVPFLVAGTDRIGVMPERIARQTVEAFGVRMVESPIEMGSLTEALWWHPARERDSGHRWLRQLCTRVGDEIDSTDP